MFPSITPEKSRTASSVLNAGQAWRWLLALATFGTVFLTYCTSDKMLGGHPMAAAVAKYPALLTPASYAFSMWETVFLALLSYAAWQLLPAQQTKVLPDAVAKPLTLASVGAGAWAVLFAQELVGPSLGVMLLVLGALVMAYGRVRRQVLAGTAPAAVGVPFSLFLGWFSVVAVLNVTTALQQAGWLTSDASALASALLVIVGLVVLTLVMSYLHGDMVFPVVVAWALVAVWVARLSTAPALGWAALAGAAIAAIGGVILAQLGTRKTPWQLREAAAAVITADIAARKAVASRVSA